MRLSSWASKFGFLGYVFGLMMMFKMHNPEIDINPTTQKCPKQVASLDSKDDTKPSTFLFIMIMTSPNSFARRKAMRETWLTYGNKNAFQYRFIIGIKNLDQGMLNLLDKEQAEYNDLGFLKDFQEGFQRLTQKLIASLEWSTTQFGPIQFLLKADDDTFVRLDKIIPELENVPPSQQDKLYWGYFDGRAEVHKWGKYAEKDWHVCDHYLPYALGGGYVLSGRLVKYVAKNKNMLVTFGAEDVSMGLWMAALNVTKKHDRRFDTEWKPRGCFNDYVVLHKRDPQSMYKKHHQLVSSHFKNQCDKESLWRPEYEYNWEVLPSKCCPGRGYD
eukprot:m.48755 g.48755  ORF g.48755 m.48755 type:complete len:330 (+) comp10583_c0_seq3:117-1106(+)